MLSLAVMRTALSTFAAVFGGLGVFFVWHSFSAPSLSVYAVVFLGAAAAITFAAPR